MHLHTPSQSPSEEASVPLEESTPPEIRNFLFLIPDSVSQPDRDAVVSVARRMTEHGYVYLAEAGRHDAEDCKDVRHLPLNEAHLPAFGLTTTVVAVDRQDLAQAALAAYPDAQVFLLNTSTNALKAAAEQAATTTAMAEHYFHYLRPWLVTGQMAAIRN